MNLYSNLNYSRQIYKKKNNFNLFEDFIILDTTKKITLDVFFSLTKQKKVLKSLNICVLSQDAKLKSIWAPILTPYISKEKITEFCNLFNKETEFLYSNEIFIPVFFLIYKNKTFSYILRTPTLFNIIKYIYDIDKIYRYFYKLSNVNKKKRKCIYYITIEELFYIIYIKFSYFLYKNKIICLKNILALFFSFGIKIV